MNRAPLLMMCSTFIQQQHTPHNPSPAPYKIYFIHILELGRSCFCCCAAVLVARAVTVADVLRRRSYPVVVAVVAAPTIKCANHFWLRAPVHKCTGSSLLPSPAGDTHVPYSGTLSLVPPPKTNIRQGGLCQLITWPSWCVPNVDKTQKWMDG